MKILYLIQTTWTWILQRSQVIELGIENYYECLVLDKKFIPSKKETLNLTLPKNIKYVPQLRGAGKIRLLAKINRFLYKKFVQQEIKKSNVIWLCSPTFYEYVPNNYKGFIIYDCMDDHVALASTNTEKNSIQRTEKNLIQRADIIFASSNRLIEIKPGMNEAFLIRNGFVAENPQLPKPPVKRERYKLGYFGAIEAWFDFESLIKSTELLGNIEYHLIGPIKLKKFGTDILNIEKTWNDKKIFLEGTVSHEQLRTSISDYDALIMPFLVNDIILSVDPVKLYEYICFGKCVISIWYPEIEHFSPYVYFYHNEDELVNLLRILSQNGFKPKYNREQQLEFLTNNSWDNRCEQILKILKNNEKFSAIMSH